MLQKSEEEESGDRRHPTPSNSPSQRLTDDPDLSASSHNNQRLLHSVSEDLHHLDLALLSEMYSNQFGIGVGDSPSLGGSLQAPSNPSYSCPVCGRYFARQWHLKRHMNIHLAVKPFNCPYCSHSANVKSNLQVHIRNIHGTTLLSSPPS